MLIERTLIVMLLFLTGAVAAADMSGMNHGSHGVYSDAGNRWTNHDDIAFLSGMIAHHQGAVAMAEKVADSKDETVRDWARDIIEAQKGEIELMESLLATMGGRDHAAEQSMRRDMDRMMDTRASDDPDVNMVILMIPHHASAIEMSLPAMTYSANFQVRKLAKNIIIAQASEIDQFRDWLSQKQPK